MSSYLQTIQYPRVEILSEPEFDVHTNLVQPTPGTLMTFVHVDVFVTSPSVIKRLLKLWPDVRSKLPPIIFCTGHVDDDKFDRFVTLFGWLPLSDTPCSDGNTRRIYVNYLKRNTDGRRTSSEDGI